MRFKLDENLDSRLVTLMADGGHDAETAFSEGLSGCDDDMIYQKCVAEGRTLVTLDLDFSNPVRFPPGPTAGIVVIRPHRPVLSLIKAALLAATTAIKSGRVKGSLWIVEPGRIRAYKTEEEAG